MLKGFIHGLFFRLSVGYRNLSVYSGEKHGENNSYPIGIGGGAFIKMCKEMLTNGNSLIKLYM